MHTGQDVCLEPDTPSTQALGRRCRRRRNRGEIDLNIDSDADVDERQEAHGGSTERSLTDEAQDARDRVLVHMAPVSDWARSVLLRT